MFIGFQGLQVHVSNVFFVETFKFITLFEGIYLFQAQRSLFVPSLNVNFASWLHQLEFHCFEMNFLSFIFKFLVFCHLQPSCVPTPLVCIYNQILLPILLCAFTTKCCCCSICMHLQPSLVSTLFVCICNQILLVFLCAFEINFVLMHLQLGFVGVFVACICN
jgi:hypothetical protein